MTPSHALLLGAAAFGGGVMNSMAGGGTLLSFPALVFVGLPSIAANATSTFALFPGAASSMAGYREEVRSHAHWLKTLFLPSLLGGALGAALLLLTPERLFARLAPFLVLFATLLFLVQGWLARRRVRTGTAPAVAEIPGRRLGIAVLAQLLIAVYGGYFGAGIGILMLAVLGFLGLEDIHAMNGLKNFFGLCINLVAAVTFALRGAVEWPLALLMIPCAMAGGYGGARFARRIGRDKARAAVVVIGLAMSALLFWQQAR